jgi:hypothetical protein
MEQQPVILFDAQKIYKKITTNSTYEDAHMEIIFGLIMLIPFLFLWVMFTGGALYPEDRIITVDSVEYHSHVTSTAWNDPNYVTGEYIEIRITDTNGAKYEFSPSKHALDNPMYAKINNGWAFLPHEQTIESGGKYKITLWHSIFMGNYVTDSFSNWNPNPEISKCVRLD